MKYVLIILAAAFLLASPIGVNYLGGAYWVLYIPLCFASFLFRKNLWDLKIFNNFSGFIFLVPSFLLFRFYEPITGYLGLGDAGFVWYFIIVLVVTDGVIIRNWDAIVALNGPIFSDHKNIARDISAVYGFIALGPSILILPALPQSGEYAAYASDVAIYSNSGVPYLVLLGYAFFMVMAVVVLRLLQPEAVLLSHNITKELVGFHDSIKGFWLMGAVFGLSIASEFFYSKQNLTLLLATWAPIWAYYLMFYYLARLSKRFEGKPLTIKPYKSEFFLAVFLITILVLVMGPILLICFIKTILPDVLLILTYGVV